MEPPAYPPPAADNAAPAPLPPAADTVAETAAPGARRELLLFALGNEWHSLPVDQVAGVEPRRTVAALPGTAPAVLGVFLWHGDVLPAFDPAPLLTGGVGPATGGFLIIGRAGGEPVGLLVDAVASVATVDPEAVEPPLLTLDPARAALVQGQVQIEGRWVTVLALESLVAALVSGSDERA